MSPGKKQQYSTSIAIEKKISTIVLFIYLYIYLNVEAAQLQMSLGGRYFEIKGIYRRKTMEEKS